MRAEIETAYISCLYEELIKYFCLILDPLPHQARDFEPTSTSPISLKLGGSHAAYLADLAQAADSLSLSVTWGEWRAVKTGVEGVVTNLSDLGSMS